MTDLKEAIERNVAQTAVWSKLRISSYIHHYHDRDVRIEGLELRHSGTDGALLLANGNLNLLHGHVYGLIGRNGVGKTTLMRHIAEHRILGLPPHLRCVYIDDESHQIGMAEGSVVGGMLARDDSDQSSPSPPTDTTNSKPPLTVLDYLISQHKAQIAAQQALKDLLEGDEEADVEALQAACDTLAALEADKAEARASKILASLDIDPSLDLNTLSGGWLHRASLAAALFVESDILLLDEPTNHLDVHGIAWLEQFLQSQSDDPINSQPDDGKGGAAKAAKKGPSGHNRKNGKKLPIVLVISHDFNFLDNVCTNIINFENGEVVTFNGNYSRFLETKMAKLAKHERMYKAQEKRRRAMNATIEKLQQRAAANPTLDLGGQIKARQKNLKNRLGASLDGVYWKYCIMGPRPEILAPIAAEPIEFNLETDVSDVPEGSGKGETVLIRIEDGGFCYQTPEELQRPQYSEDGEARPAPPSIFPQPLNISVSLSSRIALVGRNGTGKSTILKLLAGELALTEGSRLAWDGLRVSFLSQHSITAARNGALGGMTPLAFVLSHHSGTPTPALRSQVVKLLQQFGIVGVLAEESTLSVLSAGQRARVLMANALFSKPHVLLLDEPTSHLDAETGSALSEALESFEGAVIVASHDVTFVENLGGSLFCTDVPEKGIAMTETTPRFGWYDHPVSTYHTQLLHEKKALEKQQLVATTASASGGKKATPVAAKPVNATASAAVADPSSSSEEQKASAPQPRGVGCRHCGGNHFSHSCPQRPEDEKKGIVMPEDYDNNAWRYQNQPTQNKAPKPAVPLPKLVEKAKDGGGDWKVAVSKSTLKRLKKGI